MGSAHGAAFAAAADATICGAYGRPLSTPPPDSCKCPSHEDTFMSWGKHGQGPRGYHHGNLKEALVRAALELIAEKGPAGFTFADAARWAGVSPAAPYRHF